MGVLQGGGGVGMLESVRVGAGWCGGGTGRGEGVRLMISWKDVG